MLKESNLNLDFVFEKSYNLANEELIDNIFEQL